MKDALSIFAGKKVIVTGHTGFKGSWLAAWLTKLGAGVVGISKDVPTTPSHFASLNFPESVRTVWGNVEDFDLINGIFRTERPDFVFHLAAVATVSESLSDPLTTFRTNIIGTANVVTACLGSPSAQAAVIVTSDKCYKNDDVPDVSFPESAELGGSEPYSASKACAEIATHALVTTTKTSGCQIATARAGNVIGGGDWSTGRIVPDCIRAWTDGRPVALRNPAATRPWQHVLEPIYGYLLLASSLATRSIGSGDAFNFGPVKNGKTVGDLVSGLARPWPAAEVQTLIDRGMPESMFLSLDSTKAAEVLSWKAILPFEDTVSWTSEWYQGHLRGTILTWEQIDRYWKYVRDLTEPSSRLF